MNILIKQGACCNQWVLTELNRAIPVFWVHCLTGIPSLLQLKQVFPATFTSGNHGRDQNLLSQNVGDLPGKWKCQGHRGTNRLQLPWPDSVCHVPLQLSLPTSQRFGYLCSRSALILHSPDLDCVQHLSKVIQSLRESQSSGPVDYTRYLLPRCVLGPSKQKFTCFCKTTFPEPGKQT